MKVILEPALLGLTTLLSFGIGHGGAGGGSLFASAGKLGTAIAYGVAQGVVSKLRGGTFRAGFAAGLVGHMAPTLNLTGDSAAAVIGRTLYAGLWGGLASVAAGGKFSDGAFQAAMTHLFNQEAGDFTDPEGVSTDEEIRMHTHFTDEQKAILNNALLSGTGAVISGVGCATTGTSCGVTLVMTAETARNMAILISGNDPVHVMGEKIGLSSGQAKRLGVATDFVVGVVGVKSVYNGVLFNSSAKITSGVVFSYSVDVVSTINTVQDLSGHAATQP